MHSLASGASVIYDVPRVVFKPHRFPVTRDLNMQENRQAAPAYHGICLNKVGCQRNGASSDRANYIHQSYIVHSSRCHSVDLHTRCSACFAIVPLDPRSSKTLFLVVRPSSSADVTTNSILSKKNLYRTACGTVTPVLEH